MDIFKIYNKSRYRKIYKLKILDIGVLIVPSKTKERKKIKFFDFINIAKFRILINKIKKLYLRPLCYDLYLYEVDTRYRLRMYLVTRGVSKTVK